MRKGRFYSILTIVVLFTILYSGVFNNSSAKNNIDPHNRSEHQTRDLHDAIDIEDNKDFTFENGVSNGTGTENDPFIIENWKFRIGSDTIGMSITNTDKYFLIRNCIFTNNKTFYHRYGNGVFWTTGIVLDQVKNGVIMNCTFIDLYNGIRASEYSIVIIKNNLFSNVSYGIRFEHTRNSLIENNSFISDGNGISLSLLSYNNIIYNNTCKNSGNGITLRRSDENQLINNSLINNAKGIEIKDSNRNKFSNNRFENNGITIRGDAEYEYFHDIDTSNTVNGKPVIYYNGEKDKTVPKNVGQVIIVSSTNILIERLKIHNTSTGIKIAYSSNISVINSDISNNKENGISISSSSEVIITNNTINYNEESAISFGGTYQVSLNNMIINNMISFNNQGISFHYNCNNFTIKQNLISDNSKYGIQLYWNCKNNLIINNSIFNNGLWGISLDSLCESNLVSYNYCFNNSIGIRLYGSDSSVISNNTLYNNKYGIGSFRSEVNIIENNTIFHNVCGIYFNYFYLSNYSKTNTVKYNVIYQNQEFGMAVNISYIDIIAGLNYWGDDSGPYHPINNSNGMGDNITEKIIFYPWLTINGEQKSLNNESDNSENNNNTDNNTFEEENMKYPETQIRTIYIFSSITILIVIILMTIAYLKFKKKSSD